jgi:hypothetical protein
MNKIKIFTYFLLGITMFYLSQKIILKENFINKIYTIPEVPGEPQDRRIRMLIKFKVLSSNYDIINTDEILELVVILDTDQNIFINFDSGSKPLSNLYESYTSTTDPTNSEIIFNSSEIKNNIFRFKVQDQDNDFYFSLQPIQIRKQASNPEDPSVEIANNKTSIKNYIYKQFFTWRENDGCNPNPCENGGTCMYGGICFCNDGWYGDTCNEYHPCLGVDCGENGTCINEDSENDGNCNCDPGYLGDNCEISERDECLSSYCLRNTPADIEDITNCLGENDSCGEGCGTINNWDTLGNTLNNGDTCLHCISIPGLSGNDGCGPHGRCSNNEECICNDGFSGDYCNIDTCNSNPNPCNGGECVRDDSENRYHCLCPSNKRGVNCELDGVIPCTYRGLEDTESYSSGDTENNICTYRNFNELPDDYSIHIDGDAAKYGLVAREVNNIDDMNPEIRGGTNQDSYRPSEFWFRRLYCRGPEADLPGGNVLRMDFNTANQRDNSGHPTRAQIPGQDIFNCTKRNGPTTRRKDHEPLAGWDPDPSAPGYYIKDTEVEELYYANCCKGLYERE